jgi:hypothetical protein
MYHHLYLRPIARHRTELKRLARPSDQADDPGVRGAVGEGVRPGPLRKAPGAFLRTPVMGKLYATRGLSQIRIDPSTEPGVGDSGDAGTISVLSGTLRTGQFTTHRTTH